MANKKSKSTDAFDVPVRLRATKGTGKDIEKVLSFLEERALSDGVAFDFKAELERYLVNRYLVLALSAEGADEATLNPYAHRAIGVFQGYIRAIQDAAGMDSVGPGISAASLLGAMAPATAGVEGGSDGTQGDDVQSEQEERGSDKATEGGDRFCLWELGRVDSRILLRFQRETLHQN
jgi:hypothetical protein